MVFVFFDLGYFYKNYFVVLLFRFYEMILGILRDLKYGRLVGELYRYVIKVKSVDICIIFCI